MITGRHKYRTHARTHKQNILIMRPIVSFHAPYPGGSGFNSQPKYRLPVLRIISTFILQSIIRYARGIRIHSPNKRAAVDPCLRRRGHWDRLGGWLVGWLFI